MAMRRASLPLELHEVMASCSLHTRPHKRICLEDRPEPSQLCCHADEWMEQGEDEMNVEPSQSPFPGRRASSCADEEYQTCVLGESGQLGVARGRLSSLSFGRGRSGGVKRDGGKEGEGARK
eukprot:scaffold33921_cov36-Tisochrysis_lutea.AAC.2